MMRQLFAILFVLCVSMGIPVSVEAAVTYVSSATGGSTATMPTHQAGDMLVVFGFNKNSHNQINAPAGWTTIHTFGNNKNSGIIAYKIAASGSETVGTWVHATALTVHVYRGQSDIYATTPPNYAGPLTGKGSSVNFPGITLNTTDGTSNLVWFVGMRGYVPTINTEGVGMTNRSTYVGVDGSIAGHDSDGGTTDGSAKVVTLGDNDRWRTYTLEIEEGVSTPVPTVSFTESTVTDGEVATTTLSWTSTDATSCTAGGDWLGTKSVSGSEVLPITSIQFYSITCTGSGGSITEYVSAAPGISVDTVLSTGNGFTVNAYDISGGATTPSIYADPANSIVGYGVTGTASGADEEIGQSGGDSEVLEVVFDNPVSEVSVEYTWLDADEYAGYTAYDSNNIIIDSSVLIGQASTVGPKITVSPPGGEAISRIEFFAPGTVGGGSLLDDYLISSVTYPATSIPVIASITNTTGSYALTGGSEGDNITVAGSGFGAVCDGSSFTIEIGTTVLPCASVSSWSDTSISFIIPTGFTADGGSGSDGLSVTAYGLSSTASDFYIYPAIDNTTPSITTGGVEGSTVILNGTHFNDTQGSGTVSFVCNSGTYSASVSSWSDTSVSVTIPSAISVSDDSCVISLTQNANDGATLTSSISDFTILPSVTSVSAIGTNAGREYVTSDTDGVIELLGQHFGSSVGTVSFVGPWGTLAGIIHTTTEGSCLASGWNSASICVEVPAGITDDVNTATIIVTRASDSTTAQAPTFTILPRVTDITPISASVGDTITISGNHLCQSGSCPTSLGALDSVVFSPSISATTLVSWVDTQIQVVVPSGAGSGLVTVTTGGVDANSENITILSTVPNSPDITSSASTGQFDANDIVVSVGDAASTTAITFKAAMSTSVSTTLALEVEVKSISTVFTGSGTIIGSSVSYPGSGTVIGSVTGSYADGTSYHWRARVRNVSTGETSNWVAFGSNPVGDGLGDGVPANIDFRIVSSAPTISGIGTPPACDADDQITDSSARISWSASSAAGSASLVNMVHLATSSSLTNTIDYSATGGAAPQVTIANLEPSTTYYYQVTSEDTLGSVTTEPNTSPYCQFVTAEETKRINKLSEYYICQSQNVDADWSGGAGVTCVSGLDGAKTFQVFVSEMTDTNIPVQTNAYVEVFGVVEAVGDVTVAVSVNGEPTRTTTITNPNGSISWRILYPVENGYNLDYPADTSAENILDVVVNGATSVSSLGAKAILNYYYFPTY